MVIPYYFKYAPDLKRTNTSWVRKFMDITKRTVRRTKEYSQIESTGVIEQRVMAAGKDSPAR